jgi:hypothetical protein
VETAGAWFFADALYGKVTYRSLASDSLRLMPLFLFFRPENAKFSGWRDERLRLVTEQAIVNGIHQTRIAQSDSSDRPHEARNGKIACRLTQSLSRLVDQLLELRRQSKIEPDIALGDWQTTLGSS